VQRFAHLWNFDPKGHLFGRIKANSRIHPSTHLTHILSVGLLHRMAEEKEKSRSKDIILWVIAVALIALAIYWYKR
jgi:hypothetical protein